MIFDNATLDETSKNLIDQYLGDQQNAFTAAEADLNSDGLNEFILRSTAGPDHLYSYKILADQGGILIALGDVRALRLIPAQHETDGVTDLVAFQNPDNDFAQTIYIWNAPSGHYKIKT